MPNAAQNFLNDEQKRRFQFVIDALNFLYPDNRYTIERTWLDHGAGMEWETIICYMRYRDSYQMLNPAEWDRIAREDDIVNLTNLVIKLAKDQENLLK